MSRAAVKRSARGQRMLMIGVAAGLLLLVGCGAGDDATAPDQPAVTGEGDAVPEVGPAGESGPTGKACDFLSPEAIERAIGTASGTGRLDEQVSSDTHRVCMFDLVDGGWVQVMFEYGGDAARHRTTTEKLGELVTEDVDEFPGGYYVPDIGFVGAQVGDHYAQVAVGTETGGPTRAQLVALMQELLAAQ